MKKLILALSALSLIGGTATPAIAANHCRDKSGKFIKCPEKALVKPKACRDSKGHFIKCK